MEKRMFVMAHAEARRRAMAAVAEAPPGWVVEVKPPTRTLPQNAMLHACCTDVSKQHQWVGRWLHGEDWKRLFVDGYLRETTGVGMTVLPSLDMTGVVSVGEPTRTMAKPRMIELIDWIGAWSAHNGVELREAA